ncbi:DUF4260 domain-containing protein [Virgibacillus salinus]|uniref:DUF4260 domain-containing protein n=1 Tax=Virgibacillus salinus TaxID=553311 RepID=A0A1H1DV14_9BACI|nr:DUF4260 domain-containing protein [Virgibacillus salinus]SDQ80099.1 protein of unknown function [Virgibacillus salinus]
MRLLLHIEGAAVLALSLFFYGYSEFSWILFLILLLVPDISMLGYLLNNKVGSILYNFFHTYTIPIAIITCGFIVSNQTVLAIGLIWSAHIGMDRMVGYGLKYPTEFKDTHLNRV